MPDELLLDTEDGDVLDEAEIPVAGELSDVAVSNELEERECCELWNAEVSVLDDEEISLVTGAVPDVNVEDVDELKGVVSEETE